MLTWLKKNQIFTNRSFCLSNVAKSKKLQSLGNIFSFHICSDAAEIKVSEDSSPLSRTHNDDFGKHFPDIDILPPFF